VTPATLTMNRLGDIACEGGGDAADGASVRWREALRNKNQPQSYTCGAASGFAVVEYFRPALHFGTFCRRVKPYPIWGTSPRKLASAYRKSGMTVSGRRRMTYRDLIPALDQTFLPDYQGHGFRCTPRSSRDIRSP